MIRRAHIMPNVEGDTNEATTIPTPTWEAGMDGSPNTLPTFFEMLVKYLPKKNANFRTLVEQGCRVEGRATALCLASGWRSTPQPLKLSEKTLSRIMIGGSYDFATSIL